MLDLIAEGRTVWAEGTYGEPVADGRLIDPDAPEVRALAALLPKETPR